MQGQQAQQLLVQSNIQFSFQIQQFQYQQLQQPQDSLWLNKSQTIPIKTGNQLQIEVMLQLRVCTHELMKNYDKQQKKIQKDFAKQMVVVFLVIAGQMDMDGWELFMNVQNDLIKPIVLNLQLGHATHYDLELETRGLGSYIRNEYFSFISQIQKNLHYYTSLIFQQLKFIINYYNATQLLNFLSFNISLSILSYSTNRVALYLIYILTFYD
ncbi:unnamed protein product [Paramecium pentaurelia]|uniref:Uncharacterized protein n=1 Tax=Paramecium pentaurelia TaxID=43138 RepID=A0A8S1XUX5_9CILI|nr:unnamed protein product [Paramecium pentaurelia]